MVDMKTKVNESLRKAAEDVFGPVDEPVPAAVVSAPPLVSPALECSPAMSPREIAEQLRAIADKIDASEQPSRQLVAADIENLVASLQTAGKIPGYEDVQGLDETLRKLSDAISKGSAGGLEAVLDDAIAKLTEVKNKKKQKQQKEQLNPSAQYKPLPVKKTGSDPEAKKPKASIHWGDDGC